jgi:hypothetical protein
MISEQLTKRVEQLHERNQAAIKRARERSQQRYKEAERSVLIVERALRQLRRGY